MATQRYRSVAEMFLARVAQTPDREAFQSPDGGGWKRYTWKQVGERVQAIAQGLRALGLSDEQRVAIVSGTRLDWIFVDLGIMCAGGATTTIYPSSTVDDCAYILKDSATVFVFAENAQQADKLAEKRGELPVKNVILIDGAPAPGGDGWVLSMDDLLARGRAWGESNPGRYEEIAKAVRPDSLATLIYTSGTTGMPKGVELTHACWAYEGWAIDELKLLKTDDTQYLWLPLAHSFGKVLEAAQLQIGFSTAVDGRIEKIVENLGVVKPTFVAAVPRIFEKVHNKMVQTAKDGGGLKWKIFQWAFSVGREVSKLKQAGKEPGGLLALKNSVATRLVFSKVQARFGGRMRFFISGSAPLSRELQEFFHAAGILICEGYGLTETSAATFVNRPDDYRFGTVGQPMPGTEVKIAPEDGEILLRGPGVMRGYHNLPDQTAETKDAEGWLHTGDIGVLHDKNFLQITDRKKDLIKTSGGKYVAPQGLEGKLKALCPYISQVVVHGNNRNFCSALITVEEESTRKWAAENGVSATSYADLAASPKVRELLQGFINQLNATLASYETIKKFAVLPADLTQEAGDLTPSLKVKRKAVEAKYKQILDGFYQGSVEAL